MHKRIVFILAAAFASLSVEAGAASQINVERDTRIVSDTGSLDAASISAQTDQTWVLAEIAPDATDGQFEGVTRDAKTGMYAQIPGHPVVKVYKGKINVISLLIGTPPAQTWAYEWDLPAGIYKQYLVSSSGTQDPYLAFYENNVIACRINSKMPAISISLYDSKFYPIYLIPAQWKNDVAPAFAYIHKNMALFQNSGSPQDADRLWRLTQSDNPFIAFQALRALCQSPEVDGTRLLRLLKSAGGLKQAIFTFEVLGLRPQQSMLPPSQAATPLGIPQSVLDVLSELTRSATSSAELDGLALGIWSASATPVGRRGQNYTAKNARLNLLYRFLEDIQKKQNTFHSHTEEDSRLGTWLRAASVPQQP